MINAKVETALSEHHSTVPMAQFSGAVKLADLNDFIGPSQACVVKLDGSKNGAVQLDNKAELDVRSEVR